MFVGMVGSPAISPNGYGLAKVGISSTNVQPLHKSQLELQKLNLPHLPNFCQTDVTSSTDY